MKTLTAEKMLSKLEAVALDKQIKTNLADLGRNLTRMRDEEGWRALGHRSWTAYCETLNESRQRVYQLMQHAAVLENLSTAVDNSDEIPERHTRALGAVEPEQQAEVYQATVAATGGAPTAEAITKAAKKPAGHGTQGTPHAKPIGEQAETNDKLRDALAYLGKVCGKKLREALENGTVPMPAKDVIRWAGEHDERIIEIEPLITVNRWTLAQAYDLLQTMPLASHKIERLLWLALANIDGEWSGTIDGVDITAKARKRK